MSGYESNRHLDGTPDVSIVIPYYNYEKYIKECIQSCLDQTHTNIEVIVLDDGSTDDGMEIVKEMRLNDKRVCYFSDGENRGYSYRKNLGIRLARADLIVHLDADDALTPDSIKMRLGMFQLRPDLDMVHGWALRWYGGDDTRGVNKKAHIHAQTVMIKKDVYRQYGLYYEGLRSKSDKEMWFRLGVHPEARVAPKINAKKIKKIVAWYRKHKKAMHKIRKQNPAVNDEINQIFKKRIRQLMLEGITKQNTEFL